MMNRFNLGFTLNIDQQIYMVHSNLVKACFQMEGQIYVFKDERKSYGFGTK